MYELTKSGAIQKLTRDILEFAQCPIHLGFYIHLVYEELRKRGYNPRKKLEPFDICDTPLSQYIKESGIYSPAYSLSDQTMQLRESECECSI
jgi:hypothetical protein